MICFRCGSPVAEATAQCPTCAQPLSGPPLAGPPPVEQPAPRAREGATGQLVADRYEIKHRLGEGPTATVYRALDHDVEIEVALKILDRERLPDWEARGRFVHTLARATQVVHPNVVRCFDVGLDGERAYMVLQLWEGLPLRKVLELRRDKAETFSLADLEPIVHQVSRGLLALHKRGLLAGTLRPENIIILPDAVKVADAAVWRELPHAQLQEILAKTQADRYLAPEVRAAALPDTRADSYSLAVVIEEMLGGPLKVPPALAEVLAEARDDDVTRRPGVVELAAEVQAVARTGRRVPPAPPRSVRPPEGQGPARAGERPLRLPMPVARDDTRPDATVRPLSPSPLSAADPLLTERTVRISDEELQVALGAEREKTRQVGEKEMLALRAASSGDTMKLGVEDILPAGEEAAGEEAAGEELRLAPPVGARPESGRPEGVFDDLKTVPVERIPPPEVATERALVARPPAPLAKPPAPDAKPPAPTAKPPSPLAKPPAPAPARSAALPRPPVTSIPSLPLRRPAGPPAPPGSAPPVSAPPGDRTKPGALAPPAAAPSPPAAPAPTAPPSLAASPPMPPQPTASRGAAATDDLDSPTPLPEPVEPTPTPISVPTRALPSARGPVLVPAPQLPQPVQRGNGSAAPVSLARPQVHSDPAAPPAPMPPSRSGPTLIVPPPPRPLEFGAHVMARRALSPLGVAILGLGFLVLTLSALGVLRWRQARDTAAERAAKEKQVEMLRRREALAKQEPQAQPAPALAPAQPAPAVLSPAPPAPAASPPPPTPVAPIVQPATSEDSAGCPLGAKRHQVDGHAFCIDAYEYPGGHIVPRTNVTWADAERACKLRGARLCTRREWLATCQGPNGASYPWGNTHDAARCNLSGAPKEAGSFPRCKSPVGTYDMIGNVAEWVAERIAVGGSAQREQARTRCDFVQRVDAATGYSDVGFRCCSNAK
ncbi:MAG TPA: protein kinase [Polyangia bacterium]|nr:protein kinase [Polyangia bacterium]